MTNIKKLSDEEIIKLSYHTINVKHLQSYCDPFKGCWIELHSPITQEEVLQYVKDKKDELVETPIWTDFAFGKKQISPEKARENHIKKIAFFVTHDIESPISIDVGCPELNCYVSHMVDDGNHRLAGAIIKGDLTIKAQVNGSLIYMKTLGLYNPNEYEIFMQKKYELKFEKNQKKIKKKFNP